MLPLGESKVRSGLPNAILNFYNLSVQKKTSLVWLLCLFPACRQAEMQSYRVPKEADRPMISAEAPEMANPVLPDSHPPVGDVLPEGHPPVSAEIPAGHPEIGGGDMTLANAAAQGLVPPSTPDVRVVWSVPSGWQEKPGSGFRYATFVIPGSGALTGDLSVTVLEGDAGGLLSNVNRWRGQIGLTDLTENQLSGASQSIRPAGRAMTFVNFVSEGLLIDGKFKKRLMAAIYSADGKSWFFKMIGEDRLVQSAEKDFLIFLESVKGL